MNGETLGYHLIDGCRGAHRVLEDCIPLQERLITGGLSKIPIGGKRQIRPYFAIKLSSQRDDG